MTQTDFAYGFAAIASRPAARSWDARKSGLALPLGSIRARSLEPLQLTRRRQKFVAVFHAASTDAKPPKKGPVSPGSNRCGTAPIKRGQRPISADDTWFTENGGRRDLCFAPGAMAHRSGDQAAERSRFVPSPEPQVFREASRKPMSRIV